MDTNESAQNPTPTAPVMPITPEKSVTKTITPIAVIAIIIAILAVGGWYFLSRDLGLSSYTPATSVDELQSSDDPAIQAAMSQSTADDLDSIQADLDATDFSGIDSASIDAGAQ
ncbi:hypothetical protein EPO56_02685 [Patescibacteria group bacterium]|nr:MAG: hypothetical protein EPO56_02685 [Patescibacteria group bacterium]